MSKLFHGREEFKEAFSKISLEDDVTRGEREEFIADSMEAHRRFKYEPYLELMPYYIVGILVILVGFVILLASDYYAKNPGNSYFNSSYINNSSIPESN